MRPTARNVKRIREILCDDKVEDPRVRGKPIDIRTMNEEYKRRAAEEKKRREDVAYALKYKPTIDVKSGGYGDLDDVARQANQGMAAWHYSRKSARLRIIWICSGVIIAIGITMTVYDSVRQKKKKQEQLDSDTEQEETKPLTSVGFAGLGAICLGVLGICIFIILKSKLNNSPYARQ